MHQAHNKWPPLLAVSQQLSITRSNAQRCHTSIRLESSQPAKSMPHLPHISLRHVSAHSEQAYRATRARLVELLAGPQTSINN